MRIGPRLRFRLETAIFFVIALGFCGAATQGQWFRTFDYAIYDALVNTFPLQPSDDVVIVGIDEQSMAALGRWPWSRSLQGELIEKIQAAGPKAVLLDFVYGGKTEPTQDAELVRAAASVDVIALPMIVDALATDSQLVEVLPYPDLLETADVIGHVHIELDADATVRGVYLFQGIGGARWPHLTLALAKQLGETDYEYPECDTTNDFSLQNHRCDFAYLSFEGPSGTVAEVSAGQLLSGAVETDYLKGKVVFVGVTAVAATDSVTGPVSGSDRPMSGVEFNTNLYNSILQNRMVREMPQGVVQLLALFCVILPVLLLPRLKAKAMLASAALFCALPVSFTVFSYVALDFNLPLAAAVLTCFLCYPYWSWRRQEVAWQFVNAEMSRQEVEKSRWAFSRQVYSGDEELARLPTLFESEGTWYEAPPGFQRDRQLSLQGGDGRWLVMSRNEPFIAQERALAEKISAQSGDQVRDRSLPGEMLAAQIRKLQLAAREVRMGREIGLRGLAEMPIGVAVISALSRVLFVNRAGRQLLGISEDFLSLELGELTSALVPPLGMSWPEICRRVVIHGESVTFETTSSSVPVVAEAAPLAEPGDVAESWVLTITDMTDVHIAERDREEALAFLSHDLRSPMLSIQALLRGKRDGDTMAEIERYTQKALSASEQFLQLSRVQARQHFEMYELDLLVVLDNAVDFVYHMALERNCEVRFSHPSDLQDGAWISGNGELLERSFVNLLTNAIKYSDHSSSVDVAIELKSDSYEVTVTDHGMGIPADEQDQVFLPYFRSKEPAMANRRGAGLGLRFVKTVVERHAGEVVVTSELGEGSQFIVTLPREASVSDDFR